jgi:hypothetical protein
VFLKFCLLGFPYFVTRVKAVTLTIVHHIQATAAM